MNSQKTSALHLLHRAGQCADVMFTNRVGPGILTPRQFEVLRAVANSVEPSQTLLVERTGIDRSTLADIVRRLVDRGLLQRKRTRRDARMYAVSLTSAGEQALAKTEPRVEAINDEILSMLEGPQRDAFVAALSRIVDQVETVNANHTAGERESA